MAINGVVVSVDPGIALEHPTRPSAVFPSTSPGLARTPGIEQVMVLKLPVDAVKAYVRWVQDGDTVRIDVASGERIRYLRPVGIDTPEVDSENGLAECAGDDAWKRLIEIAPVGMTLLLEKDRSGWDKYRRMLRHVWITSGCSYRDGPFLIDRRTRNLTLRELTVPPLFEHSLLQTFPI